ncbi:hypothetical protein [Paenibacillus agaridevorans]|uniref:hypothetical protein n=1 Tax=Paenibacillus agaridevorans TaxID=171404 RepID=UPI001BE43E6D|nr:hypothetical protein [Paenibacillus agaridevorans]
MITADSLLPTIRKIVASYLEEIGTSESQQNQYIFIFITEALRKLANIAYVMRVSDPMTISGEGFITFQRSGQSIIDLYAPLRIMDSTGKEVVKRTAYADTKSGWWRESSNTPIHVKGLNGAYTLHYIAYPSTVASASSPVEFPDAGSLGLSYHVAAMIMESRPHAKDLAAHYYALSQRYLKIAVQANIDARGHSSGGFVPSLNTVDSAFGGG